MGSKSNYSKNQSSEFAQKSFTPVSTYRSQNVSKTKTNFENPVSSKTQNQFEASPLKHITITNQKTNTVCNKPSVPKADDRSNKSYLNRPRVASPYRAQTRNQTEVNSLIIDSRWHRAQNCPEESSQSESNTKSNSKSDNPGTNDGGTRRCFTPVSITRPQTAKAKRITSLTTNSSIPNTQIQSDRSHLKCFTAASSYLAQTKMEVNSLAQDIRTTEGQSRKCLTPTVANRPQTANKRKINSLPCTPEVQSRFMLPRQCFTPEPTSRPETPNKVRSNSLTNKSYTPEAQIVRKCFIPLPTSRPQTANRARSNSPKQCTSKSQSRGYESSLQCFSLEPTSRPQTANRARSSSPKSCTSKTQSRGYESSEPTGRPPTANRVRSSSSTNKPCSPRTPIQSRESSRKCFTPLSSYRPQTANKIGAQSSPEKACAPETQIVSDRSRSKYSTENKLPNTSIYQHVIRPSDMNTPWRKANVISPGKQESGLLKLIKQTTANTRSSRVIPVSTNETFPKGPLPKPESPRTRSVSKSKDIYESIRVANKNKKEENKPRTSEKITDLFRIEDCLGGKGCRLPIEENRCSYDSVKSLSGNKGYSILRKNTGSKGKKSKKKDINFIIEDCRKLETAYANRKNRDGPSKRTNCDILNKLLILISDEETKASKTNEKTVHCILNYLRGHSYLLYELVHIVSDTEDFPTCSLAVKLLYELTIADNDLIQYSDRSRLKRTLGSLDIYEAFIESLYCVHVKFSIGLECKSDYHNVQAKLLSIIVTLCKTRQHRLQFKSASDGAISVIGKLVSTYHKNKELADNLLEAVRVVCVKKCNCNMLVSKRFFDGLCDCFKHTQKAFTLIIILRSMSKYDTAINFMNSSEKLFNVILELISYIGKKTLNKPALLTTLCRLTKNENSLKIISRDEMFYRLFHFLIKHDRNDEIHRIGKIKAYSILSRSVDRTVLLTENHDVDLGLPPQVRKYLEEERNYEDSDNEESDDDSQEDDESDVPECTLDCQIQKSCSKRLTSTNDDQKARDKEFEESLSYMIPYFSEYVPMNNETVYYNPTRFEIYQGLDKQPINMRILENRVHKGRNANKHAFPDAIILEPQPEDYTLNPSINNFPLNRLTTKIKCLKGLTENKYTPRIVYDLDYFCKNLQKPTDIPHPQSFKLDNVGTANAPNCQVLKFESRFECGNLKKAVQVDKYEYDLLINFDTNYSRGSHWFYFQVSNMVPALNYTFNIVNFVKGSSQYNHGMQPLMFSVTDYLINKTGWKRVGEEIVYYGNNYMDESGERQYKTLSFSVSFPFTNDYVYFAYHYPYTYTRLMIKLFPLLNYKSSEIYARVDKLCKTVTAKNEVALLTITGSWTRRDSLRIPFASRPIVFITARVHPGETNASWIMEGIIKFLLDEQNEDAIKAREHFIFKMVPMLNPEGVIHGNGRTSLTGADLNRCWAKPNKITCPEIYNAKRLIACAKRELRLPIAAYIDIHGHSRKKFCFFYGCNPKMSWNSKDKLIGDLQDTLKLLPETVQGINSNINLAQCRYKIEKCREATGRVVMWREFDIKHSYTLECSFSFGSNKQGVNTKVLSDIGASVIASFGRIADKAYSTKKVYSSLSLDFSSTRSTFTTGDQVFTSTTLREEINNARTLLTLSRSILDNSKQNSPRSTTSNCTGNTSRNSSLRSSPLHIGSRVFEKN